MFNGIIESIGKIKSLSQNEGDIDLTVSYDESIFNDISNGDSIAINGICLTLKKYDSKFLYFDVSIETNSRTSGFKISQHVNLERSLKFNGRISGHFISGHVDAVGKIIEITKKDKCEEWVIQAPEYLMKFITEKCSITIDGVSLTVNKVEDEKFYINLIPFTLKETCFDNLKLKNEVNIEIDMLARYVQKLMVS
jgi:riboflavin synthase